MVLPHSEKTRGKAIKWHFSILVVQSKLQDVSYDFHLKVDCNLVDFDMFQFLQGKITAGAVKKFHENYCYGQLLPHVDQ